MHMLFNYAQRQLCKAGALVPEFW